MVSQGEFSNTLSRSYPELWTEDSQLPKLLNSQMQSFLSLQNRVFSTIIEVISVNIVRLIGLLHS